MKRKIITIDEDKCNGCGACVTGCAEGALRIVDGKARLVKEQFCDGFGDCIGHCPTGALKIEERDTRDDFDIQATKQHLMKTQGVEAVRRMEEANVAHERGEHPSPRKPVPSEAHSGGGCPGSRMRVMDRGQAARAQPVNAGADVGHVMQSDLQQWPVQIHLVQAGAPFFKNKEMVVLSTCAPVASADVHWRFLRGRSVVVGCPKLDDTGPYAEKLGAILAEPTIPAVIIVRMEVPCCGGLTSIAREAVALSGRTDLRLEEVTIGLSGDVVRRQVLSL